MTKFAIFWLLIDENSLFFGSKFAIFWAWSTEFLIFFRTWSTRFAIFLQLINKICDFSANYWHNSRLFHIQQTELVVLRRTINETLIFSVPDRNSRIFRTWSTTFQIFRSPIDEIWYFSMPGRRNFAVFQQLLDEICDFPWSLDDLLNVLKTNRSTKMASAD